MAPFIPRLNSRDQDSRYDRHRYEADADSYQDRKLSNSDHGQNNDRGNDRGGESGHGADDVRHLAFWHEAVEDEESTPRQQPGRETDGDWQDRQSPMTFAFIIAILVVMSASGWFLYRWLSPQTPASPPLITADEGAFRVRPDHPGGMVIPHQDKLVYGRLSPATSPQIEHLLPPHEQPMGPEESAYGYPQQMPENQQTFTQGQYQENDQDQYQRSPQGGREDPLQQEQNPDYIYETRNANESNQPVVPPSMTQGQYVGGYPPVAQNNHAHSAYPPRASAPAYTVQQDPRQNFRQDQPQVQGQGYVPAAQQPLENSKIRLRSTESGEQGENYAVDNLDEPGDRVGMRQGAAILSADSGMLKGQPFPAAQQEGGAGQKSNRQQGKESAKAQGKILVKTGGVSDSSSVEMQTSTSQDQQDALDFSEITQLIEQETKTAKTTGGKNMQNRPQDPGRPGGHNLDKKNVTNTALPAAFIQPFLPPVAVSEERVSGQVPLADGGKYMVQIASVATQDAAAHEWQRLKKAAEPGVFKNKGMMIQKIERGQKSIYRLIVGPFNSSAEAEKLTDKLKAQKVKGVILSSGND